MMLSGSHLEEEEIISDSEFGEDDENELFVPESFEDFQTIFKNPYYGDSEEPQSVETEIENRVEQELSNITETHLTRQTCEPETGDEFSKKIDENYHEDDLSGKLISSLEWI